MQLLLDLPLDFQNETTFDRKKASLINQGLELKIQGQNAQNLVCILQNDDTI